MSFDKEIRVRIAPSPTGDPHVGLAYVTLFNYVFAKKYDGKVVLRIEDTDQSRSKASSEERIMASLRWLDLEWDEGPDVGGEYGPYRQSERKKIYREHVDTLLSKGFAYRCFCSEDRLKSLREEQKQKNARHGYDGKCRELDSAEAEARERNGESCVVRLKIPKEGKSSFVDELRGEIEFDVSQMDDQILLKSDGMPTYHLANVVDDHLMRISHVIRAEEWISSTPKHILLYTALGWEQPTFVHLPLLRNPDHSKISKRKNPTSVEFTEGKESYRERCLTFSL